VARYMAGNHGLQIAGLEIEQQFPLIAL
jgi:hypothetical protein